MKICCVFRSKVSCTCEQKLKQLFIIRQTEHFILTFVVLILHHNICYIFTDFPRRTGIASTNVIHLGPHFEFYKQIATRQLHFELHSYQLVSVPIQQCLRHISNNLWGRFVHFNESTSGCVYSSIYQLTLLRSLIQVDICQIIGKVRCKVVRKNIWIGNCFDFYHTFSLTTHI